MRIFARILLLILAFALPAEAGLSSWIKEAKNGNHEKQHLLGVAYYNGSDGAERNYKKAYGWFRKAAAGKYAPSYLMLGDMYYYGLYVNADEKEAFNWYMKAAKKGNSAAMERLGDLYADSKLLGNNLYEAAKWYKKAAEKGGTSGPYSKLARLYYLGGDHFKKDEEKALEYFIKAFNAGDYDAAHFIAGILEDHGYYRKAVKWLKAGAMRRSSLAIYQLAKIYGGLREYAVSDIAERNYPEAYKWLYILLRKDFRPEYRKDIAVVAAKMDSAGIKKARLRAKKLLKKLATGEEIKSSRYFSKNPPELK